MELMGSVSGQQQILRERLGESGWEIVELSLLDEWWAEEMWTLESTWSPRGQKAYLTFLVDPQADVPRRKKGQDIWALIASSEVPAHHSPRARELLMPLGYGWEKELPKLLAYLSQLRQK